MMFKLFHLQVQIIRKRTLKKNIQSELSTYLSFCVKNLKWCCTCRRVKCCMNKFWVLIKKISIVEVIENDLYMFYPEIRLENKFSPFI